MKTKIDWFFLRRTLIFLFISIVFSVAVIFLGWQYEDAKYEEYQNGAANLSTTHRLYKNMVNDIDLLEQYTTKYSDYKATGLVGGERRLSWIESLESTNSVLKLPKLSFTLLPQEDFVRPGLKVDRNVEVKSSPMQLDISLMHEGDLFALFDGLALSISNLFTVDSCTISLMGGVGQQFNTQSANLNANCVIRWISIDAKS
jgi:hypothetical protein